jgi:ketosteroid isomerase-like protein
MDFRGGRIWRTRVYFNRSDALKAVGLEEPAVSQENVETVRRAIAAINARDIDAYLACCTENVELLLPLTFGSRCSAFKQSTTHGARPSAGRIDWPRQRDRDRC